MLNTELGLEPGPELQRLQRRILEHDSELEPAPPRGARRRRRALAAAALAAVVLAVAVSTGLVALAFGDDAGTPPAAAAADRGRVIAVDAETGRIRRWIDVGRNPVAVAAGGGSVWVVDAGARTVVHVGETSRALETLSTGATPIDVAVGDDAVWVANGRPSERAQFVGALPSGLVRLDLATRSQRGEVELPVATGQVLNVVDNHVAVGAGAVWAVTADGSVVRIDAATGRRTAVVRPFAALAVAAGGAGVWALALDGRVARLDPRTARPVIRTRIPSSSVAAIAVGRDAAWVTSPAEGRVWRIGPGRASTLGSIDLARGITDVAAGPSGVWVVNSLARTLTRVDPRTASVARTLELEGIPRSVAVEGETVWVAVEPGLGETVNEEAKGIRTFAAPTCEPPLTAGGRADVLIVSDLPLQGSTRLQTRQMAQAIAFVLRQHRFRAGRFRVAYQSCDDALATTGLFDEPKCAANGRAYAHNDDVIGVIGTLHSACATSVLPELNRAPGGPLAMISPINSFVGLTRSALGVDPSLPASLYPTGRRNYVRVFPTDDLQGAALALLARDAGRKRVFVLTDGNPGYGALMALGFETAAGRLGLTIAGKAAWDPGAKAYAALADRVAAARPAAVFLGGLLDTNGARVARDLRARLGPSVALLAPDGFTPLSLFVEQAGKAAIGVHVSLGGVVTERLPAAGTRFVERFSPTQAGAEIEPSAVYAAQAAEVLLDAIARSDGTRSSVLHELFRTTGARTACSATSRFDRNGDITERPVTILRAERPGGSNAVVSIRGRGRRLRRPAVARARPLSGRCGGAGRCPAPGSSDATGRRPPC